MSDSTDSLFNENQLNTAKVITFGKYKGKPLQVLANDPSYCDWLMAQGWFRETHQTLYQIIINNFGEPSITPEHNALQKRFLNDNFCLALARLYSWIPLEYDKCIKIVDNELHNIDDQLALLSIDDDAYDDNSLVSQYKNVIRVFNGKPIINKTPAELLDNKKKFIETKEYLLSHNSTFRVNKKFENGGWDVDLSFYYDVPNYWRFGDDLRDFNISIEIKPSLGDDYPVILRQMKAVSNRISSTKCLVYDKFNATGATIEEVKEIFATAHFRVLSLSDIENAKRELLSLDSQSTV
jgi:hypothetical protein